MVRISDIPIQEIKNLWVYPVKLEHGYVWCLGIKGDSFLYEYDFDLVKNAMNEYDRIRELLPPNLVI